MSTNSRRLTFGAALFAATIVATSAFAQALSYLPPARSDVPLSQYAPQQQQQDDTASDELAAPLQRQVVIYPTTEPPGTVIIDTAHTFLYLTLGNGQAMRYGIGVGRQGFTWSGVETISRKAEWPDWIPPVEMVARQPYLPRWVGGGPGNPLGARALYLGNSDYRIHGTNDPTSIGKHVSSGCIRLRDADVIDLYSRVGVGTKVVVLPNDQGRSAANESQRVAIEDHRGGLMTARIFVGPAVVAPQTAAQNAASVRTGAVY
jgi:lipoprotein-anchoring transpeptidase ErfK/SrfK